MSGFAEELEQELAPKPKRPGSMGDFRRSEGEDAKRQAWLSTVPSWHPIHRRPEEQEEAYAKHLAGKVQGPPAPTPEQSAAMRTDNAKRRIAEAPEPLGTDEQNTEYRRLAHDRSVGFPFPKPEFTPEDLERIGADPYMAAAHREDQRRNAEYEASLARQMNGLAGVATVMGGYIGLTGPVGLARESAMARVPARLAGEVVANASPVPFTPNPVQIAEGVAKRAPKAAAASFADEMAPLLRQTDEAAARAAAAAGPEFPPAPRADVGVPEEMLPPAAKAMGEDVLPPVRAAADGPVLPGDPPIVRPAEWGESGYDDLLTGLDPSPEGKLRHTAASDQAAAKWGERQSAELKAELHAIYDDMRKRGVMTDAEYRALTRDDPPPVVDPALHPKTAQLALTPEQTRDVARADSATSPGGAPGAGEVLRPSGMERVGRQIASRYGPGNPERGAALIPSMDDLKDAVARAGLIDNRKLEKFSLPNDPGVNVAHLEAIRRNATSGAGDTAEDVVTSVYRGITDHEYDAGLDEYPVLRRELDMLNDGMPIEDGRQALDVINRMAEIESKVDPARLRDFMARFDQANDEMFDRMVRMGKIDPGAKKKDYARRIVIPHYEGGGGLGGGAAGGSGGRRELTPGSAKRTVGTDAAIERSASRALAFHVNEVLSAEASHDFFDTVRTKFAKNLDVRSNPNHPTEGLALYKIDGAGGPGEILKDRDIAKVVKDALAKERVVPPSPGGASPGGRSVELTRLEDNGKGVREEVTFYKQIPHDGPILVQNGHRPDGSPNVTEYHLLPKELAEGLVEAHAPRKMPGLLRGIGKINSTVKGLLLHPNLKYQIVQQIQDAASAYGNVPITQARMLAQRAAHHADRLITEYGRTAAGHRSTYLEAARKEGMLGGGNFESFIDDAADSAGHIVPAEKIPLRFRTGVDQAKAVAGNALTDPLGMKLVGQIREATWKMAVKDLVENAGGTAKRGVVYAQEAMGNYWRTSEVGKYLGPITQFTKWFTTAAQRVTLGMAKDPISGKGATLRGLWWGPMPKIAAKAAVIAAANTAMLAVWRARGVEPKPSERNDGTFGKGLLTPLKDEKGNPIWLDVDGYSDVLDAVIEPIVDARKAGFGTAAEGIARKAGGRIGSPVRVPAELMVNERLGSGAPIESDASRAMGTDAQAARNPFGVGDRAQYALEQFGGYPARIAARVMDDKATWGDVARSAIGNPLEGTDPREGVEQEARKYGGAYYDQFANLIRQPPSEDKQAKMLALYQWAIKHGLDDEWDKQLTRGMNAEVERDVLSRDMRKQQRLSRYPAPEAEPVFPWESAPGR